MTLYQEVIGAMAQRYWKALDEQQEIPQIENLAGVRMSASRESAILTQRRIFC